MSELSTLALADPADAREIADLMTRLQSNSVRNAGGQLHQFMLGRCRR